MLLRQYLLKNWTGIKTRGKTRFVLLYGALMWGVSTAAVSTLIFYIFAPSISTAKFAGIVFMVYPVLGMFVGTHLWQQLNRNADSP